MFDIPADREKLERAVQAIKSGNTARGKQLLNELLLENPRNVLAILWLTKCTDDPRQQAVLYQHALNIEPDNPHALKGVKLFSQYLSPAASTPAPNPDKLSRARREIAARREQEPQAKPSAPQFQPEPPPPIEQPSAPQFQPDAPPRTDSGKKLLNVAIGVAVALLLIVLALIIAPSLSGPLTIAPSLSGPSNPTDVPTPTTPPCTNADYHSIVRATIREWDDAASVAAATPRISISGPVADLQAIHRRTEALPVRICYQDVHAHLLSSQKAYIDGLIAWMAQDYAYIFLFQTSEDEKAAMADALSKLP